MAHKTRSREELAGIARDVVHGKVFGTWSLPKKDSHLLSSVFMILAFASPTTAKEMADDGIVHLFEYIDKAGPRSINGYPMFMSAHMVNKEESEIIGEMVKKLNAAEIAALEVIAA